MKQYRVQVRLSYYAMVDVEAENDDAAQSLAIRNSWRAMDKGDGVWGEEPEVMFILEGEHE